MSRIQGRKRKRKHYSSDYIGSDVPEQNAKKKKKPIVSREENSDNQEIEHELPNLSQYDMDDLSLDDGTNTENRLIIKKKKRKHRHEDDRPLLNVSGHKISYINMSFDPIGGIDNSLHSEHPDLEYVGKKKKKNKHNSLDLETSDNVISASESHAKASSRPQEDTGLLTEPNEITVLEEGLQPEHLNLEESMKKKKKKHRNLYHETTVHYSIPAESHIEDDSIYWGGTGLLGKPYKTSVFDNSLHLEESGHKKKKKRHKNLDMGTSKYNISVPDGYAEEGYGHQKDTAKLAKENETAVFDNSLHSEQPNLEKSVRKKKKKHRLERETLSNNIQTLESHIQDGCTPDTKLDYLNRKAPKKDQKQRKTDLPMKETSGEYEQMPSVDHCHPEEKCPSEAPDENIDEWGYIKKKKRRKKDTGALKDTLVEDVQPLTCEVDTNCREASKKPKKKKKNSEDGLLFDKEGAKYKMDDLLHENTKVHKKKNQTELMQKVIGCDSDNGSSTGNDGNSPMDAETNNDDKMQANSINNEGGNQKEATEIEQSISNKEASSKTGCKKRSESRIQSRLKVAAFLKTMRQRDVAILEEYFPDLRTRSFWYIRALNYLELERIKEAKAKGIMYRTGKFHRDEDAIIRKNVDDFVKLVGLETPEVLFHPYKYKDQQPVITKLKRRFNFSHRIAEGLYRPIAEVISRGQKLFNLNTKKGRYTEEEVENLRKQMAIHGRNWGPIALALGRTKQNAQIKSTQIRRDFKKGRWSIDEVNRLISAVKKTVLRSLKGEEEEEDTEIPEPVWISKEHLYKSMRWHKVEEEVLTRNWTNCKSKWNVILLLRMNDGINPFTGILGIYNHIKMLKWLHEADIMHGQVDWHGLCDHIGNVPPGILQLQLYLMKIKYIPDSECMNYKEVVEYLYEEYLPVLEEKLATKLASQGSFLEEPEKNEQFLFRDIFREYTGDEKKNARMIEKHIV